MDALDPKLSLVKMHGEMCDHLKKVFHDKNSLYGFSVWDTYDREGEAAWRIRLHDKLSRYDILSSLSNEDQTANDAKLDTLMDLANYAIIAYCCIAIHDDILVDWFSEKKINMSIDEADAIENGLNTIAYVAQNIKISMEMNKGDNKKAIRIFKKICGFCNDIKVANLEVAKIFNVLNVREGGHMDAFAQLINNTRDIGQNEIGILAMVHDILDSIEGDHPYDGRYVNAITENINNITRKSYECLTIIFGEDYKRSDKYDG